MRLNAPDTGTSVNICSFHPFPGHLRSPFPATPHPRDPKVRPRVAWVRGDSPNCAETGHEGGLGWHTLLHRQQVHRKLFNNAFRTLGSGLDYSLITHISLSIYPFCTILLSPNPCKNFDCIIFSMII